MAGLSDADRALIRDEIGVGEPPTDDDLDDAYTELVVQAGAGTWRRVAVRFLKRRLADLETGQVGVSIPGVVSIGRGMQPSPDMVLAKIQRLTAEDAGATGGRLRRGDTGRGWPLTAPPWRRW